MILINGRKINSNFATGYILIISRVAILYKWNKICKGVGSAGKELQKTKIPVYELNSKVKAQTNFL